MKGHAKILLNSRIKKHQILFSLFPGIFVQKTAFLAHEHATIHHIIKHVIPACYTETQDEADHFFQLTAE